MTHDVKYSALNTIAYNLVRSTARLRSQSPHDDTLVVQSWYYTDSTKCLPSSFRRMNFQRASEQRRHCQMTEASFHGSDSSRSQHGLLSNLLGSDCSLFSLVDGCRTWSKDHTHTMHYFFRCLCAPQTYCCREKTQSPFIIVAHSPYMSFRFPVSLSFSSTVPAQTTRKSTHT